MTILEQGDRESMARSVVECPVCHSRAAWLGEQGTSIHLHGKCLTCLLFVDYRDADGTDLEAEADEKVRQAQALREEREQWTGRRIFPCVNHRSVDCPLCAGEGWILGYPPKAAYANKG